MKHRISATLFAASFLALSAMSCVSDLEGDETEQPTESETAAAIAAPFDLHCLYAGEAYASRAPNIYAANAIRYACDIQARLIPYKAPGWWDTLQFRAPTVAEGIDCSGLTSNVWFRATNGWDRLPHSARGQELALRHVSWAEMLPGDLMFYYSASAASGRHVSMYLGDGLMIEARGTNYGVVVSPVRTNVTSIGRAW
jgi:cell wall-associated NlpC family hydrolase